MHVHFADFAIFHLAFQHDLVARCDVGDIVKRLFVILARRVRVIGVVLIIESDAWADDVEHGDAVVRQCGFEQFLDLFRVPSE